MRTQVSFAFSRYQYMNSNRTGALQLLREVYTHVVQKHVDAYEKQVYWYNLSFGSNIVAYHDRENHYSQKGLRPYQLQPRSARFLEEWRRLVSNADLI